MSETDDRIDKFRKMAEADPDNELGHFSLGRACMDAAQYEQAAKSFERAIELNPKLSKAYQFLATSLLKLKNKDAAIARLTQGVKVAAERGDMMPRDEMVRMLKDLGAPVPAEAARKAPEQAVGAGQVHCARCNRIGRQQASPPFSSAQGQLIYQKICADCWREWIGMGTKVINELRLPLSDPQAQKVFDQHMMEFLNLK